MIHISRLRKPEIADEITEAVMAFEALIHVHEKTVSPMVWAYVANCFAEQLGRMKTWPERSET